MARAARCLFPRTARGLLADATCLPIALRLRTTKKAAGYETVSLCQSFGLA